MKNVELVFILDRSGSMSGLESDTIGGYNSMLEKQKKEENNVNVTTVLFNDGYQLLHDRVAISKVKKLTGKDYQVGGCTALIDAIGKTISRFEEQVDDNTSVMMVVTTDGLENASRQYTLPQVRKMIEAATEKGWEFIFLGANIDAVETAAGFGIRAERAVNFVNDSRGIQTNFGALNQALHCFVTKKEIDESWREEIDRDYNSR